MSGSNDTSDQTTRYAVTALLVKANGSGVDYQLMLDVIEAKDEQDARARFGLWAKDSWPALGLQEIIAVEVATP